MSILNTPVSWFHHYNDPKPAGQTTLLPWLQSCKLINKVKQIRAISDKKEKDKLKATLPAITPSGIFSYRKAEGLVKHSGFICLDIDLKGNERIRNYNQLKNEMAKLVQVAYCGLSVSGNGYFVLIPVAFPEKHLLHFYALQKQFAALGIQIDEKCKDISRLRGYSCDTEAYYNHHAKPFTGLYSQPDKTDKSIVQHARPQGNDAQLVETLLEKIVQTQTDITEDYNYWFAIGCNFAATFGEAGRPYFHQVSQFYKDYTYPTADKKFDSCLKKSIGSSPGIGAFINRCKDFDIYLSAQPKTSHHLPLSQGPVNQAVESDSTKPEPVGTNPDPMPNGTQNQGFTSLLHTPKAPNPQFMVDIANLASFFENVPGLPPSLLLEPGAQITDTKKFIASHLEVIKANNGNPGFQGFVKRLENLKKILLNAHIV